MQSDKAYILVCRSVPVHSIHQGSSIFTREGCHCLLNRVVGLLLEGLIVLGLASIPGWWPVTGTSLVLHDGMIAVKYHTPTLGCNVVLQLGTTAEQC